MKRYSPIFWMLLIVSLNACTKVIDVDIDQAPARVVIEGQVTNGAGPHTVHLTKSVGISESNAFPAVQGAFVRIADDAGHADTLHETTPGYYATSTLQGLPGLVYTLTVTVGDETFTAASTMPQPVAITSVFNLTAEIFGQVRYPVVLTMDDPAHVSNHYRFITQVNGVRDEGSISTNDDFFDGQSAQIFLQGVGADVQPGDTVGIEMQCIDGPVYEYFSSFTAAGNGPGGSSAPANPYTNIVGNAIGYFNACAVETRTLVIR